MRRISFDTENVTMDCPIAEIISSKEECLDCDWFSHFEGNNVMCEHYEVDRPFNHEDHSKA